MSFNPAPLSRDGKSGTLVCAAAIEQNIANVTVAVRAVRSIIWTRSTGLRAALPASRYLLAAFAGRGLSGRRR